MFPLKPKLSVPSSSIPALKPSIHFNKTSHQKQNLSDWFKSAKDAADKADNFTKEYIDKPSRQAEMDEATKGMSKEHAWEEIKVLKQRLKDLNDRD